MSLPPFEPCFLCKSATSVVLESLPSLMDGITPWHRACCAPCQLRGPLRPTDAEAVQAWNQEVTLTEDTAT